MLRISSISQSPQTSVYLHIQHCTCPFQTMRNIQRRRSLNHLKMIRVMDNDPVGFIGIGRDVDVKRLLVT